jgi:DNA-binding transcriptional MerR regulator
MDLSAGKEIDTEKRKEENRGMWEEKVRGAKAIAELCDIVEEIGSTEADGKVIHPDVMKFRLETFKFLSEEEVDYNELKRITPEFGIREKAEEIMSRKRLEPEKIKELNEELDELKEAHDEKLVKFKDLKSFFGKNLPSLSIETDAEFQNIKARMEEIEKILGENDVEGYLTKAA